MDSATEMMERGETAAERVARHQREGDRASRLGTGVTRADFLHILDIVGEYSARNHEFKTANLCGMLSQQLHEDWTTPAPPEGKNVPG